MVMIGLPYVLFDFELYSYPFDKICIFLRKEGGTPQIERHSNIKVDCFTSRIHHCNHLNYTVLPNPRRQFYGKSVNYFEINITKLIITKYCPQPKNLAEDCPVVFNPKTDRLFL